MNLCVSFCSSTFLNTKQLPLTEDRPTGNVVYFWHGLRDKSRPKPSLKFKHLGHSVS